METFYSWIKNIVFFLLLTSFIYQILPDSDYKKYVKVCLGLILVLVTIWPLMQWSGTTESLSYYMDLAYAKIDAQSFEAMSVDAKNQRMTAVITQYKTQLEQQVMALFEGSGLYPVDIQMAVVEDVNSDSYGRVLSVDIAAVNDTTVIKDVLENRENMISVAPIEVPLIGDANLDSGDSERLNDEADKKNQYSAAATSENDSISKDLRQRIAQLLFIDTQQVNIELKEGI